MTVTTIPVGMMGTNCYILTSGDKEDCPCAIIDPGAQPEKVIDEIKRLGAEPKYILLTHGHYDHIGGVKKLMAAYPDARLYIGEKDMEMLGDTQKSLAIFRSDDDSNFIIGHASPVSDGDILELGELSIKAIETPGHTMGGITYICCDAMFAGDTLFLGDVGRTDLYGGDYSSLLDSLKRLWELDGDYRVYPGHGESATLGYERKNNSYIREALQQPDK